MRVIVGTVTVYETVYCPGTGPFFTMEGGPNDCPKPEGTTKATQAQAMDRGNFI
jgi:hypothetical protein